MVLGGWWGVGVGGGGGCVGGWRWRWEPQQGQRQSGEGGERMTTAKYRPAGDLPLHCKYSYNTKAQSSPFPPPVAYMTAPHTTNTLINISKPELKLCGS